MVPEWCRMNNGGGDGRLHEARGDLWLLCLLPHVLYTFLYGAMTPSISMFHLYIQDSSLQESVYENIVKTCWLLALTLTLTMFWFFFMIQTVNLFAAVRHRYRCDFLCITMLALLGRSEGTTQCTCVITMIFLWISEYAIYTTHEQILACCTKHVYCCLTERLKN